MPVMISLTSKKHPHQLLQSELFSKCFAATEPYPAALLLTRIVMARNALAKLGAENAWIPNKMANWCEALGFTSATLTSAIARLEQLGLIVAEQHTVGGSEMLRFRVVADL